MQEAIDMIKDLRGTGYVEISDLTSLYTFNESLGKTERYFLAGMDKKPTARTKDNDFSKKKYLVVDLDIRKDYQEKHGKLLTDDELIDEIAKVNQRIEESELSDWSYLVHSGNGVHYYYVGDEIELTPEQYSNGCEYFYSLFDAVARDYRADTACKNIARVSRLPGSVNSRAKFGIDPIEVEILVSQPQKSRHYNSIKEYARLYKEEKTQEKQVVKEVIQEARSMTYDEKYKEINDIPMQEIVQRFRGYDLVQRDSTVISLKDKGKNIGVYIYTPTNALVASGTTVTSIITSGKKKFNVHTFVKDEMYGGNEKKAREYFESNYGIIIKDKGEIPKKKQYRKIGYEYPGEAFDSFDCLMSGEFVVIVAGANSGKTTFAMNILEHNGSMGKSGFYVNCEFDITNVPTQRRLEKNGKRKRNLTDLEPLTQEEQISLDNYVQYYLKKFDYHNASEGIDIDDLVEILKKQHSKGKGLFVIDTLSGIHYGNETNRNAIDKKVTHTLMQLCENTGMCIILLHHTNKAGDFSGTQKIKDRARVFLMIERQSDARGVDITSFMLTKDKFVNNKEIECLRQDGKYIRNDTSIY